MRCDISPYEKGNTKLLGGLSCEKIQRYNNSPPYVIAMWPPQQIPPLNFLAPSTQIMPGTVPFKKDLSRLCS